ncbi:YitT family protein [Emticicia sp. C21]|uniref:YitT family protein n=1 Tax=Emticicia sp. C21 TaxID=2302915 RepID=UPI000E34D1A9|nr:YitT family protein [Emticicia sp. C21]RFS14412.1 YitT family protein [Emticicia sp. C21]
MRKEKENVLLRLPKIILNALLNLLKDDDEKHADRSKYQIAKEIREVKVTIRRLIKDFFLISVGVLSAGFGLDGFLLPNEFIDGGATGISLLITAAQDYPLSLMLIIVNIPFVIIGLTVVGKEFAIKTAIGIAALALAVAFIPYPEITHDKLLTSVFGGFFLGLGIGMAMRGGGVIDGTEVLAITLSRRMGLTIGDVILVINVIIFSVAAYVLSMETALYSMLTYLSASKTVDFVIEGIEEYTGVTIISLKAAEIKKMIIEEMGRGVTVYKGERGFGKTGYTEGEMKIVYTVITRLEVSKLNLEIEKIDPNAFVVMTSIKDTKGGMIKKRSVPH